MTNDQRTTTNAQRLLLVVLFVSLAWTAAPRLFTLAHDASDLQHLPPAARRARVNGPIVADVEVIKRAVPQNERIALIGPSDHRIFANYYGYPWLSRDYAQLDHYRLGAGDRLRPKTIVAAGDGGARITTYAELRDARLRHGRVMHSAPLRPAPTEFIVPLAGSVDGSPPDTYVTEADLANDADLPAHVRLRMMPEQKAAMVTIPPHGRVAFYDLIYQLFGVMEVRWVDVESDQPLYAGFWFVNRGRNEVAPLPFVIGWATEPLTCPTGECKAWLINRNNQDVTAFVGDTLVTVPALATTSRPFRGTVNVSSAAAVFAFATTIEHPTRFVWPRQGIQQ